MPVCVFGAEAASYIRCQFAYAEFAHTNGVKESLVDNKMIASECLEIK
jgi:hypothetical protein